MLNNYVQKRFFIALFFLVILGCKTEKEKITYQDYEKNKFLAHYLYKTMNWQVYYESSNEDESLTDADFSVYFLPEKLCIIHVAERYDILSKDRFESGSWTVIAPNTILIESANENISIRRDSSVKTAEVNGKETEIEVGEINKREILFSNQEIWDEVAGDWIPKIQNYNGAFQNLQIKKNSPFFNFNFKEHDEYGKAVYYFYDNGLLYLDTGKVYKLLLGVDETEKKTDDILLSLIGPSEEIISLNLKRTSNKE